MERIKPVSNPDRLGDLVDPWDLYMMGKIPLSDLPEDEQDEARTLLSTNG